MRGRLVSRETYQRILLGVATTLACLGVLLAVMFPLRAHMSVAIPALVLVLPAVVGVVVGGFWVGVIGAIGGFATYDYLFLPPYDTFSVRSAQNWIALVVYVVVVLIVAQVVARLRAAREEALRRTEETGRLYELSQALIGDLSVSQLLDHIVQTVQGVFTPRWTALVLPAVERGGGTDALRVAARAGLPLTEADVASLTSSGGTTRSLGLFDSDAVRRVSLALVVNDDPVGMLVLQDVHLRTQERNLLGTFANQAALAVDRAQLREQALRARVLEEVDRWRSALMGAVSHDLRTPLASIKTSVSSLRERGDALGSEDRAQLLELIEQQSDRLARLVTNLLDMTRIEAGALELRPAAIPLEELVAEALGSLGATVPAARISVDAPEGLPLLHIDHVLVSQVLANVLENAERLSPAASVIHVAGRVAPGLEPTMVEISVQDEGPGIAASEHERVFEMFSQNGGGGRAGLGLTIAKAFIEAHGGHIWIDPDQPRGARIVFTVPAETLVPAAV